MAKSGYLTYDSTTPNQTSKNKSVSNLAPNTFRFTGSPENWITALRLNTWALNNNNQRLWEKLKPGDLILFHATRNSEFITQGKSAIIGFGYVAKGKYRKDDWWWMQEKKDRQNYWPYVVPITDIHVFANTQQLDLKTPLLEKSKEVIQKEIKTLISTALP